MIRFFFFGKLLVFCQYLVTGFLYFAKSKTSSFLAMDEMYVQYCCCCCLSRVSPITSPKRKPLCSIFVRLLYKNINFSGYSLSFYSITSGCPINEPALTPKEENRSWVSERQKYSLRIKKYKTKQNKTPHQPGNKNKRRPKKSI